MLLHVSVLSPELGNSPKYNEDNQTHEDIEVVHVVSKQGRKALFDENHDQTGERYHPAEHPERFVNENLL
jgi:hypothetical protein